MEIGVADLADGDVRDLVALHQRRMYEASPPGTSFAFDLSGLDRPNVTVFEAREDGALLAIGALMELSPEAGEIKSMRAADAALGRGIGKAMLDHIVDVARSRGYRRLLLETGTGDIFAPANGLYARHGFTRRGPFGDYKESGFNVFYEKPL